MPDSFQILSFIETFKSIYRTIEVLSSIKKEAESWRAVGIVLHVRIQPPEVVREEFRNLEETYGRINTDRFQIVQFCCDFEDLNEIETNLRNGVLNFDKFQIKFPNGISIQSIGGYVSDSLNGFSVGEAIRWPILKTQKDLDTKESLQQILGTEPKIFRDSEVAGYLDPYTAINHLLGVKVHGGSYPTLWFGCDLPARIERFIVLRNSIGPLSLTVQVLAKTGISGLSCNFRQKDRSHEDKIVFQKVLPLSASKMMGDLQQWEGTVDLNLEPGFRDRVSIELIQNDVGRLYAKTISPLEMLPREERNPLFVALTRFCGVERIKELLESPQIIKTPDNYSLKKVDKLYEVSVQWLLSVMGFQAVWLHSYEKMEVSGYDYGSVDCLAYHVSRHALLLVNCTTGPPNQTEIERQKELQHRLAVDLFDKTTVTLYSVVFTASHRKGGDIESLRSDDVRIFYRDDMESLLNLIEKGIENNFMEKIINPLSF